MKRGTRKGRRSIRREQRREAWSLTGGFCFYCGCPLPKFANWHVDHADPVSNGGEHHARNFLPSCPPCNLLKRTRTVEEFRSFLRVDWFFGEQPGILDLADIAGAGYGDDGQTVACDWDVMWQLWCLAAEYHKHIVAGEQPS